MATELRFKVGDRVRLAQLPMDAFGHLMDACGEIVRVSANGYDVKFDNWITEYDLLDKYLEVA